MDELNSITILISVVAASITAIVSAWKYFDTKKREQERLEFENFHVFLKKVAEPEKGHSGLFMIDVQAAHIFELRFFKRYHSFTLRFLKRLKKKWEEEHAHQTLLEEVNDSIVYIEGYLGAFSETNTVDGSSGK